MKVSKEFKFEAAHILPRHPGKCANLHGHSWRLLVELEGSISQKTGFVVDFNDLAKWVDPVVEMLDHKLLNCFVRYPSSENMCLFIAHELRARLPFEYSDDIDKMIIRVSETQKTWASYDSSDPVDTRLLDLAGPDAEWRAPRTGLQGGTDLTVAVNHLTAILPDLQKKYFDALTSLEEIKLYISSMDDNPILPDFKKGD